MLCHGTCPDKIYYFNPYIILFMDDNNYNYKRFKLSHYSGHETFDGPQVGEKAPNFSAYNLQGEEVELFDFLNKPIVLETGSITCNVYTANVPLMCDLVNEFHGFNFLVLYVREAHPGERIGPHESLGEKMERASMLEDEVDEKRTILVDSLEGDAHRKYGADPDIIYIISRDRQVLYREQWNHVDKLKEVLEAIRDGRNIPDPVGFKEPGAVSISRLFRGGVLAAWDFFKELPKIMWQGN